MRILLFFGNDDYLMIAQVYMGDALQCQYEICGTCFTSFEQVFYAISQPSDPPRWVTVLRFTSLAMTCLGSEVSTTSSRGAQRRGDPGTRFTERNNGFSECDISRRYLVSLRRFVPFKS
jgi:hypothetical protein